MDQKHFDLLTEDVDFFNKWRLRFPDTRIDLATANLAGLCLAGADLSKADLTGANLSGTDLSYADLTGAVITDIKLWNVNFEGTKF